MGVPDIVQPLFNDCLHSVGILIGHGVTKAVRNTQFDPFLQCRASLLTPQKDVALAWMQTL